MARRHEKPFAEGEVNNEDGKVECNGRNNTDDAIEVTSERKEVDTELGADERRESSDGDNEVGALGLTPEEWSEHYASVGGGGHYESFTDQAKEFVSELYAGSALEHTVDKIREKPHSLIAKARAMFNSKILEIYDKPAERISHQLRDIESQLAFLQGVSSDGSRRSAVLDRMRETYGSRIPPESEAQRIRENRNNAKQIEKLKNKKDRLESRLRYYNDKKKIYENARKEICEEFIDRVSPKLEEHEKNIDSLIKDREQLDSEILRFRESTDKYRGDLEELMKRRNDKLTTKWEKKENWWIYGKLGGWQEI